MVKPSVWGLAVTTTCFFGRTIASDPSGNICSQNKTIGAAFARAVNLSWPGLESAKAAAEAGDYATLCDDVAAYYRGGNTTSWLRTGSVSPSTRLVGGGVDAMVFNDTFTGFPSPAGPVRMPRTADGGLNWTWYGPDDDDEFMNTFNRHYYFSELLQAWEDTGNPVYPNFFQDIVLDWTLHLPCNNASSTTTGAERCVPLGTRGSSDRVCSWDDETLGGACATGTAESPWRSLEMGIRMPKWAEAFFGFQQSDNFTVDARVMLLLGVSEHIQALVVDGGHPGSGTVNWEMTQWQGLLTATAAWPELTGAHNAAVTALGYLTDLLQSGVYADGVETEMAAGYDMGTAIDYFDVLYLAHEAGPVLPEVPPAMYSRVETMYEYGAYIADPGGCLPRHGDTDHCSVGYYSNAAEFFNRSDWTYVRTNGQYGTPPSGPAHSTPSSFFDWAGQASLRSSYDANASWVFFDVGPYGSNAFHAHRDKLGILLHAYGAWLLVDSGRFAYDGTSFSHSLRDYCHYTHAHNSLRIDGKQQAQTPPLASSPRPNTTWSFEPEYDIVTGSMGDYDDLNGSACHSRSVFHQRGQWFVVVDGISSDRGGRTVQATWHCHPNATVSNTSTTTTGTVFTITGADGKTGLPSEAQLSIIPATGAQASSWNVGSSVVKGVFKNQSAANEYQGWYSASYDDAVAAPVVVHDAQMSANETQAVFAWLLLASPTPQTQVSASAEITSFSAGIADISVTVDGLVTNISVPVESCE